MKNIFRDKLGKFRSLKINLLDGQRRGEVVFRRVFLLVVLYIIVMLVLKLVTTKPEEQMEIEEVEAVERIVWEGDQKVRYTADGEKRYVYQDYVPKPEEEEVVEVPGKGIVDDSVRQYIKSYGGKIDDGYLSLLREYCSEDTLKVVVAISVAETSMGKNTDKQSNYFGWRKGGDINYDPTASEMAQEICRGVQKSYMTIGYNRAVTEAYTGGDRVDIWTSNFRSAFESM